MEIGLQICGKGYGERVTKLTSLILGREQKSFLSQGNQLSIPSYIHYDHRISRLFSEVVKELIQLHLMLSGPLFLKVCEQVVRFRITQVAAMQLD